MKTAYELESFLNEPMRNTGTHCYSNEEQLSYTLYKVIDVLVEMANAIEFIKKEQEDGKTG